LKDQVVVITGAGTGMGRATAMRLAREGAAVCLVGRRAPLLNEVLENVRDHAPRSRSYPTDITVDAELHSLRDQLERDFEAVDVLIHSAGVIKLAPVETAPIEDFDWQYRTNVRAPFLLTQLLLPMLKARSGQIVFINSTTGLTAKPGVSQYSATKFALRAFADSLRDEVNKNAVRVLSLYPGRTRGPMQEALVEAEGKEYEPERMMRPEDVGDLVYCALNLPRSSEVTDLTVRPLSPPK